MATRQYIGARYVPLYDGTWSATKNYEALTIVEFNNGSYISKKVCVAGIVPTNTEYWANIGVHTQQIEDLIEEITDIGDNLETTQIALNALSDDVRPLLRKRYIFIGDSYGNDVDQTGWIDTTINYMGLSANDYYKSYAGGSGFTVGTTFLTQLNTLATNISDKDSITDIVVCGGFNDSGATKQSVVNAITSFVTTAKSIFPNAKIHIGEIGWCFGSTTRKSIVDVSIAGYKEGAIINHCCYIAGAYQTAHDYRNFVYEDGNYGVHPIDYTDMGMYIANYLMGGNTNYHKYFEQNNPLVSAQAGVNISSKGAFSISNEMCTTIFTDVSLTGTITVSNTTPYNIASIPLTFMNNGGGVTLNSNIATYVDAICFKSGVRSHHIWKAEMSTGYVRIVPDISEAFDTVIIQNMTFNLPAILC